MFPDFEGTLLLGHPLFPLEIGTLGLQEGTFPPDVGNFDSEGAMVVWVEGRNGAWLPPQIR